METWKATHRIDLTNTHAGQNKRVRFGVRLVEDQRGDGPAYTREEWNADGRADWERRNGGWYFQGQAAPDAFTRVSVREV